MIKDILDPEEAQPSMAYNNTVEQNISQQYYANEIKLDLERIDSFDDLSFQPVEVIEIPVRYKGRNTLAEIRLKAIPNETRKKIVRKFERLSLGVKKTFNRETNTWYHDENSEPYKKWLLDLNDATEEVNYLKILYSWEREFKDADGTIVFDNINPDVIPDSQDEAKGVECLKRMKLPKSTIDLICKEVDRISFRAEEEEDDLEGKK